MGELSCQSVELGLAPTCPSQKLHSGCGCKPLANNNGWSGYGTWDSRTGRAGQAGPLPRCQGPPLLLSPGPVL